MCNCKISFSQWTQHIEENSYVLCPVLKENLTLRETGTIYGHIPGATRTAEQICLLQHIPEVEMCHVRVG